LGDEPSQLHRLDDVVKAHLRHAQEEIEQATQALKQVQGVIIEEKVQMKKEKEHLLTEKLEVKEAVNRALCSMTSLETQSKDRVTHQVEKLAEAI
jgi:hypothetical protein